MGDRSDFVESEIQVDDVQANKTVSTRRISRRGVVKVKKRNKNKSKTSDSTWICQICDKEFSGKL